jgi:hypothetical protein
LGRRFAQANLVAVREDLSECRTLASLVGDQDGVQQADAILAGFPV